MPDFSYPGVYIEEVEISTKSIKGVSTSTAGFLGETERGPTLPRLVTSWLDYQRIYGTFFGKTKYLPYAVEGFFKNGGKRCYVARIVPSCATKAILSLNANNSKALVVEAIGEGTWGRRIAVRTKRNTDHKTFMLTVFYWKSNIAAPFDSNDRANKDLPQPFVSEVYEIVSVEKASPYYYETIVNGNSNLIRISKTTNGSIEIPDDQADGLPMLLTNSTGLETTPTLNDYKGDGALPIGSRRGLSSFEDIDDISILYIPDMQSINDLYDEVIAQCEKLRDRFAIVEVPRGTKNPNITLKSKMDTKYAALYCPWIEILDSVSSSKILVPPGGHIAGIYARNDLEEGVHKAPANQLVTGAEGIEYLYSKSIQDTLNSIGINLIRKFAGRGIRVWGARTLSSDPLWKYVNIRRLFMFLEKSIVKGTKWVVFEPNNERLWIKMKQEISGFLTTVWRNGALMGRISEEAFFVKCDRTTMTQEDIDNGRVIAVIGVAPIKPAEFVIFSISHFAGTG